MLDPKTSENSCSFIGKFINTVIKHTAQALGDNLDLILKAVISKMQSSQVALVQQSLIIVFAHLIHTQMENVLMFLSKLPGIILGLGDKLLKFRHDNDCFYFKHQLELRH